MFLKILLRSLTRLVYGVGCRIVESARAAEIRAKKARFASCGAAVLIRSDVIIHGPEQITAGRNISIGDGCRIMAVGGLTIGDNVIISRDVTIYCSDHAFGNEYALPFGAERRSRPVTIGANVWIGAHSRILPGVTIGEGAIVGMGAIVTDNVPALAIVGQSKFRVIGWRDSTDYAAAVAAGKYHLVSGSVK